MVVVRGVNIYPGAIEEILRTCGGVAEYRVEIRTDRALPELSIQVEPLPGGESAASVERRLESALRNALALRISVSAVPPGKLPRFEMKAKRWVRL
jgi:phenylacetate-CoA ligase